MDKYEFMTVVQETFNNCKDETEVTKKFLQMQQTIKEMYALHKQYAKLGILAGQSIE